MFELKCKVAQHCGSCHQYSGSLWDTYLFILFCLSHRIHKVRGFSYHSVWWNVPIVPPRRLNSMKCQFEINCEKSNWKSNSSTWEERRSHGREWSGGEGRQENADAGWDTERREGFWEKGSCDLGKARITVWESAVKTSKYFGLSRQANPFYPPGKTAILEEKCFIPAHFLLRAIGGTSNQYIVKCHRKLGWGRLMNPPFPSS